MPNITHIYSARAVFSVFTTTLAHEFGQCYSLQFYTDVSMCSTVGVIFDDKARILLLIDLHTIVRK